MRESSAKAPSPFPEAPSKHLARGITAQAREPRPDSGGNHYQENERPSLYKIFRDHPNQCNLMGGGVKNATPSPHLGSKERSRHVHKNPTEKPHNSPILAEILSKQTRPQNPSGSRFTRGWKGGAPGWDRTIDSRFRRPVLYPLSYGRVGKMKNLRFLLFY